MALGVSEMRWGFLAWVLFFHLEKAIKHLGKEKALPTCRQVRGKTNFSERYGSRTHNLIDPDTHPPVTPR